MAAYNFSIVHLSVFLCYTISLLSYVYGSGFSVDLIHRDSPRSPFFSSADKASDRAENAIRRSINRCDHFGKKSSSAKSSNKLSSNITSTVLPSGEGDYLMLLAVGTPALPLFATVDTGSDIIWFQCSPCDVCFPQIISPIFAPQNSSTYIDILCATKECDALSSVSNAIPCDGTACKYNISYGDGSISVGNFAHETLTFQSTSADETVIPVPNMAFGCGHNNTGIFSALGAGLVGLDAGPFSLVSQLGSSIDNKFSYCLVNNSNIATSKLTFGSNPKLVSGSGVVSTPIVFKASDFFYFLTLEAISVGETRIPFNTSSTTSAVPLEQGNIIIDSGSTITSLPTDFYAAFEAEMKKAITIDPVPDPNTSLSLCYPGDSDPALVPTVTAHFTGADIVLSPLNLFRHNGDDNEFACLAFRPTDGLAIYGNVVQNNFIVEYDLVNKLVSFMSTDCEMA
ncbi:hypothetical protein MKW94_017184 [Papaver nudicaule]|uniref:Peptidase A1 domain-containing protein n=1 Tax=Papaver nudicaule TaxID=74823 RepID=A0AA41VTN1_PAPNU|nr:hypothetical protein [Papaver nudicaule]